MSSLGLARSTALLLDLSVGDGDAGQLSRLDPESLVFIEPDCRPSCWPPMRCLDAPAADAVVTSCLDLMYLSKSAPQSRSSRGLVTLSVTV